MPISWKRLDQKALKISVEDATFKYSTKNDYWFKILSKKNCLELNAI